MTTQSFAAVGVGAALGAWLRWALGALLNPIFPTLPLGTLAANLLGGFVMGVAMAMFDHYQALAPEFRLFVATGFLGGLTTFSTFSAETAILLTRGELAWSAAIVAAHVIGSVALTLAGFALAQVAFGGRIP
ncbi:MAG TPA: fluoride efflux transporter CrcB [Usitatibacter sp.]|nr:fluoride efflux transporter CrcB [Usitatibacter sp.]